MQDLLRVAPPLASVAVFVAPYKTVTDIRKNQTTGDLPALTFVSMSVMCAIWGTYGGLIGDMTVLLPNLFGSVLSLYYLHVFETYTPKGVKSNELSRWYQAGIILLALILLQVTFGDVKNASGVVGTCGTILAIIFSISPLSALPAVIRTRSPESIPLPTALMMFTNSALWMAYAMFVVDDSSIYISNLVGVLAAAVQFSVHVLFKAGLLARNTEGVKVASL